MRRRITLAIVGTVAIALLVAGAGTIALAGIQQRRNAATDLRADAAALVASVTRQEEVDAGAAARRQLLRNLAKRLRVSDVGIVQVSARNDVKVVGATKPNDLPGPVTASDLTNSSTITTLRAHKSVSGHHGSTTWAAAPSATSNRGAFLAVVLTRKGTLLPRDLMPWFLIGSGIALAAAVLVSMRLSDTLTRPLRAADGAARRIADGDLSTRLPEPPFQADDELADLTRAINTMAASLERARKVDQQFLLSVSHDLRTPLTSIRGWAEAIQEGAADDPRHAAAVIDSESRRLERLVADLLQLSRLDARQFTFQIERLELGPVVADAAEAFRPEADSAAVALTVFAGASAPVAADRDRLAQVIANLVENALKYATSRVDVAVGQAAATEPSGSWITVTDDGPGIAPDDLPHVFERLYVARANPVRKETGSGLGLAIVRELVTAMGGTVAAGPAGSGRPGTQFVVRLPAANS
ncbi:MAG: HAMP domain-containing sensor histidine kinase [Acidimicrobiales bacterium]